MKLFRKFLLLITIITLVCIQKSFVFGLTVETNGNNYNGGVLSGCNGKNCFWNYQHGIRISLVDANGNKVSGTTHIDLWIMSKFSAANLSYDLTPAGTGNFDGALYGNQIKQDVINNPQGLVAGKYFDNSNVYDIKDVINHDFSASYNRSQPGWIKVIAEYIKNNTSDSNTTIIDSVLEKTGYTGGVRGAASSNYFLQYEPLLFHGRIGSNITNYIFIGTPTEYLAYDEAKAGAKSGWFSKRTTGVFIYRDGPGEAPNNFTIGTGSGVNNLLSKNGSNKIIGEAVAHIWLRDLVNFRNLDCDDAIEYINENYTVGTSAYDNQVSKVIDGTFSYIDGVGIQHNIDRAYNDRTLYYHLFHYDPSPAACTPRNGGGPPSCTDYASSSINSEKGAKVNVDNCTNGISFFRDFEDSEAWLVCEYAYAKDGTTYSSDNTGHVNSDGSVVGNKEYCEVFCYEEVEIDFPTHVSAVKAGQTFTWGSPDGTFGTLKFKKKCSTQDYIRGSQGYRFEEWEEDYKSNAKKIIKHYMNYLSYKEASSDSNITLSSRGKYTGCRVCSTCGEDNHPCNCHNTCNYRYKGIAVSDEIENSYTHSYLGTITGSAGEVTAETDYIYTSSSAAKAAAKALLIEKLNEKADEEYFKYGEYLSNEQELLDKMKQCTTEMDYTLGTKIRFIFEEPVNSVYGSNTRQFSFDGNLVTDGYDYYNSSVNGNCSDETVYRYSCSGTTCSKTAKTVSNCTGVSWDLEGTVTYKYPADKFTWYSLKTDSTLVNEENKDIGEDEAFFYSIGFGLPTSFSLTNGTYELKVIVGDLGDMSRTDGNQDYNVENGHFAPLTSEVDTGGVTSDYGFEYVCSYEVENDIFGHDCQYDDTGKLISGSPDYCDNKEDSSSKGSLIGLDITYRLIDLLSSEDSLDKAFPSIDGDGREPGENWQIGTTEIYKVLRDDIYDESAMYEIMLDVNAIQKIREDNQTYFDAGKDPYTSYYDGDNNQKVYCVTNEEQEKYCASDFISELYQGSGLNYQLMGSCLPTINTLDRAEYILENGCNAIYTYPTIDWTR